MSQALITGEKQVMALSSSRAYDSRPKVARVVEKAADRAVANFKAVVKHIDFSIVVLERQPKLERVLEENGIAVVPVIASSLDRARHFNLPGVRAALDTIAPDVVMTTGWAGVMNLVALDWASGHGVPVITTTDSNRHDYPRNRFKECGKAQLISMFSGIWAAGPEAADYAAELGVPCERIVEGPVNAADWEHFFTGAEKARANAAALRSELGVPERFFLTVSRLSPEKNVPGLLRAFTSYRSQTGTGAWDLVVVGDGPQRPEIESLIDRLALTGNVHLAGWQSRDAVPSYYGLASAFVLASTREPWGVVVTEAATAGLPLVVSDRCGSAHSLVQQGVNGFIVSPDEPGPLCEALTKLSHGAVDLDAMSRASREISLRWHPERHAESFADVVHTVLRLPPLRVSHWKIAALRLAVEHLAG